MAELSSWRVWYYDGRSCIVKAATKPDAEDEGIREADRWLRRAKGLDREQRRKAGKISKIEAVA